MPGLLRLFGEDIVLGLVQLQVMDGFEIVMAVRVLQRLRNRLGDRVLHAVDIQVM
jgi:hypothetical protein